mgnify:CR=1 FL=1
MVDIDSIRKLYFVLLESVEYMLARGHQYYPQPDPSPVLPDPPQRPAHELEGRFRKEGEVSQGPVLHLAAVKALSIHLRVVPCPSPDGPDAPSTPAHRLCPSR